jgi:uncharacterized membrane protein
MPASDPWLLLLKLALVLGAGLVAGVFYAFSTFVMKALDRLPPAHAIAAMQSINVVVLNRWFLGVFVGTAALCGAALVAALLNRATPQAFYLAAGAILYIAGSFLVTLLFNVPRNEALAAQQPDAPAGAALWRLYRSEWTRWNHVRTAASLAAAACFCLALVA